MTEDSPGYDASTESEKHVKYLLLGMVDEDTMSLFLSLIRRLKADPTVMVTAGQLCLSGRLAQAVQCAESLLGQARPESFSSSAPAQTMVGAPDWLGEVEELLLAIAKRRNIKIEQESP